MGSSDDHARLFLGFYARNGRTPIFGLPLSEAFIEKGQTVQYFERTRMVFSGGAVHLSPLGLLLTADRSLLPASPVPNGVSQSYFPATGHAPYGDFLTFWQQHGGIAILGPPISDPTYEQNGDGTGHTYLVQYFRNARMEYHPQTRNSTCRIALGLLGAAYIRRQRLR